MVEAHHAKIKGIGTEPPFCWRFSMAGLNTCNAHGEASNHNMANGQNPVPPVNIPIPT